MRVNNQFVSELEYNNYPISIRFSSGRHIIDSLFLSILCLIIGINYGVKHCTLVIHTQRIREKKNVFFKQKRVNNKQK